MVAGGIVVAHVCHPMASALAALRDVEEDERPRLSRYGVCGPAVKEMFCAWAKKALDTVTIWGSSKCGESTARLPLSTSRGFEVLLFFSHPDELKTFHSWQETESRLRDWVVFRARTYSPVGVDPFKEILDQLMREFDFVQEIGGNLSESFEEADIAIYCHTNAGLLASRYGTLAAAVDLNDLIQVSPCLDPSGPPSIVRKP